VGQLGNRKRSFLESPYPSKKFEYRHNVENVIAGLDSTAVIVEDTGRVKKKKENSNKRTLKLNQVAQSEEELQEKAKLMIQKEEEEKDSRGRTPLGERLRENFHKRFYGESKDKEAK